MIDFGGKNKMSRIPWGGGRVGMMEKEGGRT